MILVTRLFLPLAVLTMLSACSLPLKVKKVESMADEVKGVRYFLKRPSYVAGLKVEFDKAEFLDYVNTKNCTKSGSRCSSDLKQAKESTGEKIVRFSIDNPDSKSEDKDSVKWIKGDQITNIRDIYCVRLLEKKPSINITLQQKMEGNPILFEAQSRTSSLPHWFADSESSITLDDNGYLTAIMAGEDDKSLEFIQAVAGLAVSAAKTFSNFDPKAPTLNQCLLIGDDNFHKYVTKYITLTARRKNLEEKLIETYQKIESRDEHTNKSQSIGVAKGNNLNNAPDTPKQMKLRFELVSLLKAEMTSIDNELEKLQYELPSNAFVVKEGPKEWIQPENEPKEQPWLTFTLTRQ